MSETIPESKLPLDIMDKAVDLYWKELRDQPSPALVAAAVARLVYSERLAQIERDAKIAEDNDSWPREGEEIAAEIRKGKHT